MAGQKKTQVSRCCWRQVDLNTKRQAEFKMIIRNKIKPATPGG